MKVRPPERTVSLHPSLQRPKGPFMKRELGNHKARNKSRNFSWMKVTDEQIVGLIHAGFRVHSPSRKLRML